MMQGEKLIYVIDDEQEISSLVCKELERFGYRTRAFDNGTDAIQVLAQKKPDVCIIDLGLPDMDGLSIVRELENFPATGVIILSGRNSLPDRVLGLEVGADDFISKPFDPREVVARTASIIRRLSKGEGTFPDTQDKRAYFDLWEFDPATLVLKSEEKRQEHVLSSAESELLVMLLKAPKRILSRDQLLNDRENSFDRSIDVRMSRIRKKIESDPKSPRLIKTVYGAGYMLTCDVNWC